MEQPAYKYPKSVHLPKSPGLQNDDRMLEDLHSFDGKTVAITVKYDGENASLYRDGYHARSLDSRHHESRCWIKSLHASIKHSIPEGWRVCGENLYAQHSIKYKSLESYFYVFNVWNENNVCLSWQDTLQFCMDRGLTHVETVELTTIRNGDFSIVEDIFAQQISKGQEGIVIRNVESFHYNDFQKNLAKMVRASHIQTSSHWMSQAVVPNKLRKV